jgi:carboxymethylenebutenolidase
MSGSFVTTIAAHHSSRIAAAASLYGVGIVTDKEDSPHLLLDEVRGELYFAFAELDPSVPANVVPDLEKALKNAKTRYSLETYPTRVTATASRRGRTSIRRPRRRPGSGCSTCGPGT